MLTKSGMRLGLALPQGFPDGRVDMALVRRFAERAEALGFDDVWAMEQTTGRFAVLEPLTLLAYVGALTRSVRLGTAVPVTNLRNPLQLAKALVSLDQETGGRLTAGIGLGTTNWLYGAFGLDPEHRVSRFVESIKVMQALWREGAATVDGRYWQLEEVAMEPKPLQRPLALWFGARSPAALRRAVRFGDGWMGAGSATNETFLEELARLRSILAAAGRDEKGVHAVEAGLHRGRPRRGAGPGAAAALDGGVLRQRVGG